MTVREDSLTDFLSGLDWSVEHAHREDLPLGTGISLPRNANSLTYVTSGSVTAVDTATGCTLAIDTQATPFLAGDFLFSSGGRPLSLRAGSDAVLVIVSLVPARSSAASLTLPDVLTVRDFAQSEPAIAQLAQSMGCPVAHMRASDEVVCGRIATIVMSAAVRAWVDRGCAPSNWLQLADDAFIARSVEAIHADPARAWTVGELAATAMMGRSAFALRFRAALGATPLQYVTSARMALAQRHLDANDASVAEVASRLGYLSEEGFSRAFRRHTGSNPSVWRATRRQLSRAS